MTPPTASHTTMKIHLVGAQRLWGTHRTTTILRTLQEQGSRDMVHHLQGAMLHMMMRDNRVTSHRRRPSPSMIVITTRRPLHNLAGGTAEQITTLVTLGECNMDSSSLFLFISTIWFSILSVHYPLLSSLQLLVDLLSLSTLLHECLVYIIDWFYQ